MTIDRTALRRLSEGITPLGCPARMDVACRLAAAVPPLLDELDAKDRRIAELEADLVLWKDSARKQAHHALRSEERRVEVEALELQLSIAADLTVVDRKRIAELEAGLRESVEALDDLTMLDPMTDEHAEPAEGERLVRLRKLLPSEET